MCCLRVGTIHIPREVYRQRLGCNVDPSFGPTNRCEPIEQCVLVRHAGHWCRPIYRTISESAHARGKQLLMSCCTRLTRLPVGSHAVAQSQHSASGQKSTPIVMAARPGSGIGPCCPLEAAHSVRARCTKRDKPTTAARPEHGHTTIASTFHNHAVYTSLGANIARVPWRTREAGRDARQYWGVLCVCVDGRRPNARWAGLVHMVARQAFRTCNVFGRS